MALMVILWWMNAGAIHFGATFGVNANISAAAAIPLLAMVSYLCQKVWVFKR
jgi:putative flippase GtrA